MDKLSLLKNFSYAKYIFYFFIIFELKVKFVFDFVVYMKVGCP
jgi:hypothetical protein